MERDENSEKTHNWILFHSNTIPFNSHNELSVAE